MTPRARRLAIGFAVATGLLFAGRAAALFLAERWWAADASPPGAVFATRWALLRLGLDAGAVLLAVAWFAFHLLVAVRGCQRAGRTQPPLDPPQVRRWAVAVALLLGVLVGSGASEWAESLLLALQRPRWGTLDQFHDLDAGFYVALLPLLIRLQFFALALVLLGLLAAGILYTVGGTLRVASRRFVLDPGIRLHLGLLGAALGVVLALGYVLEPWEFASGLRPATGAAHVVLLSSMAWLLVGLSLAAAALTGYWGLRGRIMLPLGAWGSLALFALVIRLLAPAAGSVGDADRDVATSRELEREAFGLPELVEVGPGQLPPAESEGLVDGLWDPRALAAPGGTWVAGVRQRWEIGGEARPVLLLVSAATRDGQLPLVMVVDDRASPDGQPLAVRDDGEPYPGVVPIRSLAAGSSHPRATGLRLDDTSSRGAGVPAGGMVRRLLLTWALQRNVLGASRSQRLSWRPDPGERLRALAPFADWSAARPVLVGGALVWLADGYLHSPAFPEVTPVPWRGQPASYLRAAFVGAVEAASGRVRIFERDQRDPLSLAWAAIARELVEPLSAMPLEWAAALQYPTELFTAHMSVLRRRHWEVGSPVSAPMGAGFDTMPAPVLRSAFQSGDGRRLVAIVEGERVGTAERLRVVRLDTVAAPEPPALLPARWERLPFVAQMRDSTLAQGWRYLAGPVRFRMTADGPLSWQPDFAIDSAGRGSLVAVNLGLGDRQLGTGPGVAAAWENLRGRRAAFPVSLGEGLRLEQARVWLLRADSALRRGDVAAFGRAFEALRAILDRP